MDQRKVWVVRGGNNNEIIDIVENDSIVALGKYIDRDVSELKTRDEFRQVNPKSDQLYRFVHEMQVGDMVLTPNKATSRAAVGRVSRLLSLVGRISVLYNATRRDMSRNKTQGICAAAGESRFPESLSCYGRIRRFPHMWKSK